MWILADRDTLIVQYYHRQSLKTAAKTVSSDSPDMQILPMFEPALDILSDLGDASELSFDWYSDALEYHKESSDVCIILDTPEEMLAKHFNLISRARPYAKNDPDFCGAAVIIDGEPRAID